MKIINERIADKKIVNGDVGYLQMLNLVELPNLIIGTRLISPNSSVPPRNHSHARRQINYVIDGEPTLTNGNETIRLKKGDFVILESFEEHYFLTTSEPAHVFEVQFA